MSKGIQLKQGSEKVYPNSCEIKTEIEKSAGYMKDDKQVYIKRYNTGQLLNNTNKNIPTGLDFINTVELVRLEGVAINPINGTSLPLPFPSVNANIQIAIVNNNIEIYTTSDRTAYTKSYIDLYYTKN